MNDEQIKQNAYEYSLQNCCVYDDNGANDMDSIREAHLAGAHSRDEEIQELREECNKLRKDKEELASVVRMLSEQIHEQNKL